MQIKQVDRNTLTADDPSFEAYSIYIKSWKSDQTTNVFWFIVLVLWNVCAVWRSWVQSVEYYWRSVKSITNYRFTPFYFLQRLFTRSIKYTTRRHCEYLFHILKSFDHRFFWLTFYSSSYWLRSLTSRQTGHETRQMIRQIANKAPG